MTRYVQKPPEIDAIQWDGTPDGAMKVREFANQFRGRPVSYLVIIENGPNYDAPLARLKIDGERLHDMHEGYWLIHEDGNNQFDIMRDDDFRRIWRLKPSVGERSDGMDFLQEKEGEVLWFHKCEMLGDITLPGDLRVCPHCGIIQLTRR